MLKLATKAEVGGDRRWAKGPVQSLIIFHVSKSTLRMTIWFTDGKFVMLRKFLIEIRSFNFLFAIILITLFMIVSRIFILQGFGQVVLTLAMPNKDMPYLIFDKICLFYVTVKHCAAMLETG